MKRKHNLIILILMILSSFLATFLLISSQNILLKNQHWIPYRARMYGLLNGGIESLLSRQVVADFKLRTERQRVFSKKVFNPTSISFSFRLNDQTSFVDVIFNANEYDYEAIRIGSKQWSTLFHYKSKHTGEFLWRKEHTLEPGMSLAHEAKLSRVPTGLELDLDGLKYQIASDFHMGQIGFDLSAKASLWNAKVESREGTEDLPFSSPEKFWTVFAVNFFIIGTIILLCSSFYGKIAYTIFFTMLCYFCFDHFLYSKKTFAFDTLTNSFTERGTTNFVSFERLRHRFFKNWYRLATGYGDHEEWKLIEEVRKKSDLKIRYCKESRCTSIQGQEVPKKEMGIKRMMVWGGSMSFGTGLETLSEAYPEVLYKILNHELGGREKIEVLNASRILPSFAQRQGYLFDDVKNFQPDVIVVDAFLWEDNISDYEKTLRHIHPLVPKVVLVRIPFNSDKSPFLKRAQHLELLAKGVQDLPHHRLDLMRFDGVILKWIREMGIIFIDPNLHLLSDDVYLHGQLFWDDVHITSYAHQEWARALSKSLLPIIRNLK